MKITLTCINCYEDTSENEQLRPEMMELIGQLYINPKIKSQSQRYKCNRCLHEISVLVEIEKNENNDIEKIITLIGEEFEIVVGEKTGWGRKEVITAFNKACVKALIRLSREKGVDVI